MRLRTLGLSLMMLMLLAFGSLVSAQDVDLDPCFGLAAADCEVINTASIGAFPSDNFTFNMSIDFAFMGMSFDPEVAPAEINFNMSGAVDVAAGEFTPNVSGVFTVDANSANLEQLAALAGGGEAGGQIALDPVSDLVIEFRIVDDMFYLANPENNEEWISLDLIALLEDPALTEGLDALPVDPTTLQQDATELAAGVDIESLLTAVNSLVNLPGLFNYTRAGNDFTWVMDLSALSLLLEDEYADTLAAFGNAIGSATGDESAAAQVDLAAGLVIGLIGPSSNISVTQTVDDSASYINALDFGTVLELSLLGTANLNVDMSVGNFDGVTSAIAPENAQAIDPAELTGMLGGLGAMTGALGG